MKSKCIKDYLKKNTSLRFLQEKKSGIPDHNWSSDDNFVWADYF